MNLERTRFEVPQGHFTAPPDLAHLAPFLLGPLQVIPAMRRIEAGGGRSIVVEPLVMQVLVTLAQAEGETLSRDDLVAECWGRRIVGDDAVNRVISRLRRALGDIAGPAVGIETIAKVGYRLAVADGGAEAAEASQREIAVPQPARRRFAGIAAALVTVAAVLTAAMLVRTPATGIAIAIEPAEATGGDSPTARFAGDLTTDLARLTGSMTRLSLVERRAPGDADMTLQVAYRAPEAGDGALVRLVDGGTGAVIWSRTFDAAGATQGVVRERAAHAIAGVIRCGLDRSTGNLGDPVSKRLYFAACDAVDARDWPRARSFAQQIAARRPDSAASWACLAMTTAHAGEGDPATREQAARQSMAYAKRALTLDPRSGLAHQALAVALEMQGGSGFAAIEDGVRLDPEHAGLQMRYSMGLFDLGYVDRAVEPALRAIALDPGDYSTAVTTFYTLLGAGRINEARDLANRIGRLWSADHDDASLRAALLFYDPHPATALAAFDSWRHDRQPMAATDRDDLAWRANSARFDWAAFDRDAEREFAADPAAAWDLARNAIRMHDPERAFVWLARARAAPGTQPWYTLYWADAAELRRDPRFFAKMAELGLVAQWQRRGSWPDFCGDPGLRYDCRREAARLAAARTT